MKSVEKVILAILMLLLICKENEDMEKSDCEEDEQNI